MAVVRTKSNEMPDDARIMLGGEFSRVRVRVRVSVDPSRDDQISRIGYISLSEKCHRYSSVSFRRDDIDRFRSHSGLMNNSVSKEKEMKKFQGQSF